ALKEKLSILEEYHTAYFVISAEELEKYSNQQGDTEGLVNYALSIGGINLAATIIEKHDCVKLSFRSVGNFSVNDLASKYFSGGGHKNAAGGMSTLSIREVEQKFLGLLPNYREKIAKA
ncbi:MAG: DHHA1 domain-containing protein, partial [Bacteroidota bacterium]